MSTLVATLTPAAAPWDLLVPPLFSDFARSLASELRFLEAASTVAFSWCLVYSLRSSVPLEGFLWSGKFGLASSVSWGCFFFDSASYGVGSSVGVFYVVMEVAIFVMCGVVGVGRAGVVY